MKVLALDLEATLISHAGRNMKPRPCLYFFLSACHEVFDKIYLFTCVSLDQAEKCLLDLRKKELIPQDFVIPVVNWYNTHPESGMTLEERWPYKDLRFVQRMMEMHGEEVPIKDIFIVDDDSGFVSPDQLEQWIPVAHYDMPYSDADTELITCFNYIQHVLYNRMEWVNEPPNDPDYYWYYGKTYTTILDEKTAEIKLHFIELRGRRYITNGWEFYPNQNSGGVWKPVRLPSLPEKKQT